MAKHTPIGAATPGTYAATVMLACEKMGTLAAASYFEVEPHVIDGWLYKDKPIPMEALEKLVVDKQVDMFESSKRLAEESGKLSELSWMGIKVAILEPWYKSCHPQTHMCITRSLDKDKMRVLTRCNDAFIANTRNRLAHDFMKSTCDWAFMVDDDMVFPCGDPGWYRSIAPQLAKLPDKYAGLRTIERLMSHQKGLVGGLYVGRNIERRAMHATTGAGYSAPADKLLPVEWVGTGSLLIHRKVFEKIQEYFPELAPRTSEGVWSYFSQTETALMRAVREVIDRIDTADDARPEEVRRILQDGVEKTMLANEMNQGEDVVFCRRAKVCGFQPYVDLGVVCTHLGTTAYVPNLSL